MKPVSSRKESDTYFMAIVIEPIGGLGNQLFVYAAGKALARRLDIPLRIDKSHFDKYPLRRFEIDSFDSNFEELRRSDRFFSVSRSHMPKFGNWSKRLVRKLASGHGRVFEEAFVFDPHFLQVRRPIRLQGYLQSWRYFEEVGDELRLELSNISSPSKFYSDQRSKIAQSKVSVAVHVRRGDYTSNRYMGVVPEAYYDRALNLLEAIVGEFQIFLFSDDENVLHDDSFLSQWRRRTTIVEAPGNSRPIESLNLIAQCNHVIMANSSFSWWGAWLGERDSRYVFYPRPWLAGALVDDRDLCLPTWISLGGE